MKFMLKKAIFKKTDEKRYKRLSLYNHCFLWTVLAKMMFEI